MKVLVISHNPITTYQSMGKTFLSLFSEFKKDELCQLYIYPSLPDVDICNSYYRITDRNIFNSYLHFGKVNGRELSLKDIDTSKHNFYENEKEENFINVKKTALKTLLRDIMWQFSHWYNKQLRSWIQREAPTCIFFAGGESKFIYNIAMRISLQYSLPIVAYICDEFYFLEHPVSFTSKVQFSLLKKKIEKLMGISKMFVTISEELNNAYSSYFQKQAITIYTGSSRSVQSASLSVGAGVKGFYYFGNLAFGRFDSLEKIGRCLETINEDRNQKYCLYIYTRTLSDSEKERIHNSKTIVYCGYVTGKDYEEAYANADILVHVESFRKQDIQRVKNSISTKIADALSSGKPLLAYGPDSISSIKYLTKEHAACVVSDERDLLDGIKAMLDKKYRERLVSQALQTAMNNHNSSNNSRLLYKELQRISDYE